MPSQFIQLEAADGHRLSAYESRPAGQPRGGLVVLQEIYGLTPHIRFVCDRYAAQGYHAVAPALYDRVGPNIVLSYTAADHPRGRVLRDTVSFTQVLADTTAAIAHLQSSGMGVATVGFCWGGTAAWLSASRLSGIKASVCYYPTHLTGMVEENPRCPVQIHLGERDHITPLSMAGALRAQHGSILEIQIYPCGHGFDCNDRSDFHAPSAALAHERTLAFLARHIA